MRELKETIKIRLPVAKFSCCLMSAAYVYVVIPASRHFIERLP